MATKAAYNPAGSDAFAATTVTRLQMPGAGNTPKLNAKFHANFGDLKSPADAPPPAKHNSKKRKSTRTSDNSGDDESRGSDSDSSSGSADSFDDLLNKSFSPAAFQKNKVVRKLHLPHAAYAVKSSAAAHRNHKLKPPSIHRGVHDHSERYAATLAQRRTKAQDDHYSGSISPTTGKVAVARRGGARSSDSEEDDFSGDGEQEEDFGDEDGDCN